MPDLVIRGKKYKIDLTKDQLEGVIAFVGLVTPNDGRNPDITLGRGNIIDKYEDFIGERTIEDFRGEAEDLNDPFIRKSMTESRYSTFLQTLEDQRLFLYNNLQFLQGMKTAAQWLQLNWSDYYVKSYMGTTEVDID